MQSFPSRYDVVCYGEILWDVLPDKSLPGGAPMNVAYHLKKLGVHPALITKTGKDAAGEKLINLLGESGLTTAYVQVDNSQVTGMVNARVKEHNEMEYDIVQPVAWDFIEWNDRFPDLMAQAQYFVFGSLTSRSPTSRETLYRLLEAAQTKVLDINLRPPHFNRSGLEQLLRKADIVKMNSSELELVAGWYSNLQSPEENMRLLQDRFHLRTVIVTKGEDGALLLDAGTIYRHEGYKVQVADTIGSGDAFLAGFISQQLKGAAPANALAFACGAGAFIASRPGACPAYNAAEINTVIHTSHHQTSLSL